MKLSPQELFLQFLFYRTRLEQLLRAFDEAHEEDLCKNPDMFDRTQETFSGKMHPNGRLRALEASLAEEDEEFLLFVLALLDAGMEVSLGLSCRLSPREFAADAALALSELAAEGLSAPVLAHRITETKAGLSRTRLALACEILSGKEE